MTKEMEQILNTLKERLESPILGTFIITFSITNWRIFVILFDFSLKATEKIQLIESQRIWNYIDIVFGVTLFYALGLPYLMQWHSQYLLTRKQKVDISKIVKMYELEMIEKLKMTNDAFMQHMSTDVNEIKNELASIREYIKQIKTGNFNDESITVLQVQIDNINTFINKIQDNYSLYAIKDKPEIQLDPNISKYLGDVSKDFEKELIRISQLKK